MEPHRQRFVDLLVAHEVIRFGTFTLKSGRSSPYFVDAGRFRTGAAMRGLGEAFADTLAVADIEVDLVFGPAYKGVPLAVATAMAIAARGRDVGWSFDRKEVKDHGEGGKFVGTVPSAGARVVVVDDVITSGLSIREAAAALRAAADVRIVAVVVAVDRMERGRSDRTTRSELAEELGAPVLPVITIAELADVLEGREHEGRIVLDPARAAAVREHLREHAGRP